jgi:hypothetical protein
MLIVSRLELFPGEGGLRHTCYNWEITDILFIIKKINRNGLIMNNYWIVRKFGARGTLFSFDRSNGPMFFIDEFLIITFSKSKSLAVNNKDS